MRILVTGANGFLGNYLIPELLKRKYEVIATGKGKCRIKVTDTFVYEEMDLQQDLIANHSEWISQMFNP